MHNAKAFRRTFLVAACGLLLAGSARGVAAERGEGADLEIGGAGDGKGRFSGVQAIAFDAENNLYVLDWGWYRVVDGKGRWTGNSLVQKFDPAGKFAAEFSIADAKLGDKHAPARLAVDGKGNVYVTEPKAGLLRRFDPQGKPAGDEAIPDAYAVAVRSFGGKEQVLVAANPPGKAVAQIEVLDAGGGRAEPIKLGRELRNVQSLAVDAQGNLYLQAEVNQIYKFAADGRLLTVLGAASRSRAEDGSELLHSVAVDSGGNLYTMTWGNPGLVSRFDPAQNTVTQRGGQFKWADPWSIHSGYVCLAVDRKDRLWVGVTGQHDPKNPNINRYHPRPAVVRTDPKFFDTSNGAVVQRDTVLLGLKAEIEAKLPYNVAYDLKPVEAEFVVRAGNRRVHDISVRWRVHDVYRAEVANGAFDLKLQDGVEARQAFSFTPPKWGWYEVSCELSHSGGRLMAVGMHVGVTPRFEGMPALVAGESPGGWDDAPRWAFCGHNVMRIHPTEQSLDKMETHVAQAAKYRLTVFAQLSDAKECNAGFVRKAVGRFKGRIKYWEIWNEPNFRMDGTKYAAMVKELYPIIKEIDPAAVVLGPTVCGINLPWHEAFYKAGGGKCVDILSIHDYEGHESIDPVHWAWKIGALRKLMAANGDAEKPIWQTERAITAVRGGNFLGACQAVRVTLHRDLLETLGIPSRHNLLYYLNEAGYTTVPSYIWSKAGPHPAALALRTREAMTVGQSYAGLLEFGATGNKMLWGLLYKGPAGSTVVLRNLGCLDLPVELTLKGGGSLEVVDAFGNALTLPARDGKVTVTAGPMPVYLRLPPGQEIEPVKIDFGRNIAAEAKFTYSAESTGKPECLTNGILEVFHDGHPNGSVYKPPVFVGKLPSLPQTLEIAFPQPRTVGKMLVFSLRADNAFCALLDYDLQYHDGKGWVTIEEVRTPCPRSDAVNTPECTATGWYLDNNFFVQRFAPVRTDKLRLVVRRTTNGFVPDDGAKAWGKVIPAQLMLREIEIYE